MSVQERNSNLNLSLCLTWETERPFLNKDRVSPYFTLKNCEWYLKSTLSKSLGTKKYFELFMLRTNEQTTIPDLMVKTYYEDKGKGLFFGHPQILGSSGKISRVQFSEMIENIYDFEYHGTLRIVCVFQEVGNSTQLSGSQKQQSVYFPLKEESLFSSTNSFEWSSAITKKQIFSYENLSKDLESLLDNEILPDVKLMVEETSIPCHRAILAARSNVFAAMFQHEMTESASGLLEIKDTDLSSMQVFLKYLYIGKIPDDLTEEKLVKLYETADKYQVQALKRLISLELMKHINEENCLTYLSLAETHSDQEFKDAVACHIVKDGSLIKSPAWIQFAAENPTLAVEVYRKFH